MRDAAINLRALSEQRDLIDHAALARPCSPRPRQAVLRVLRLSGIATAPDDADAAPEHRQGLREQK